MIKPNNVKCLFCGKGRYMPKNRLPTFKYCSRKCQGLDARIKIKRNCEICQKEFTHISSRCNKAKYCSRKCYYKSQLKFDKGTTEFTCIFCCRKFMDSPCKERRFCSTGCSNEFRKSYTLEPESPRNFRLFWKRRGIIQNCEKCGYHKVKQILGIHHIDKNRNNNKRENLMVLCPMCHSLIHRKHICH